MIDNYSLYFKVYLTYSKKKQPHLDKDDLVNCKWSVNTLFTP